jgi:hypothetical protein
MRPSFDQYKSVYDVMCRISQQWQKMIVEEGSSFYERKNNYDSFIGEYCSDHQEPNYAVNVGHNSALMDGAVLLPCITLMADPHIENWKVCKEGILYLLLYLHVLCIYILKPFQKPVSKVSDKLCHTL